MTGGYYWVIRTLNKYKPQSFSLLVLFTIAKNKISNLLNVNSYKQVHKNVVSGQTGDF